MSEYSRMTAGLGEARLVGQRWIKPRRGRWLTLRGVAVAGLAVAAVATLLARFP